MIEQLLKYSELRLNQKLPSFRRFLFDKIDFTSKLVGIIGARGSGKTTLMLQHLNTLSIPRDEFLYISCDHPLLASNSLFEIAEEFAKFGGKVLAIDEIHKKDNFCIQLKSIYDFFDIQVIFTGSSAIHLERCQSDLSRRALVHRLPELSFREFLELRTNEKFNSYSLEEILHTHVDITSKVNRKIKPLKHYLEYLKFGAYPFFSEGESNYLQKLVEIIRQTLTEDIATIYNVSISSIDSLNKLLEVICRSKPFEIKYEKISLASGISKNTLKNYLLYLEEASLTRSVGGMSGGSAYISKPDKIYLHNTNLFEVLCGKNELGTIRETFFMQQLDYVHSLHYPKKGDFLVDEKYTFEIGGKNKSFEQIKDLKNSFVVADEIETGFKNKIPLWVFGFLY